VIVTSRRHRAVLSISVLALVMAWGTVAGLAFLVVDRLRAGDVADPRAYLGLVLPFAATVWLLGSELRVCFTQGDTLVVHSVLRVVRLRASATRIDYSIRGARAATLVVHVTDGDQEADLGFAMPVDRAQGKRLVARCAAALGLADGAPIPAEAPPPARSYLALVLLTTLLGAGLVSALAVALLVGG
jgi:hypothetical protein